MKAPKVSGIAGPRMLETDDGRFHLEDVGEGRAIVLLHGFALDLRMWDDQFETFSRRHRVVRYDLRGFGRSSTPDGKPYSHAGDLLRILDSLNIERGFIVGLSLGSNVALHFATEHPERILGLVLASPSLPGYPWRWAGDRPREAAGDLAKRDGVEAAKAYWSGHALFASARARPQVSQKLMRMTEAYSGWHWMHEDTQIKIPPLHPRLKDITKPTLVVSGGEDIDAYRDIAHIIAEGVSGANLTSIASAGHMVNMEAPSEFNEAVLDFIASSTGNS